MIKVTLELPEFEKELNVSFTLRKDGEVVYTSPSLLADKEASSWKQVAVEEEDVESVVPSPKPKKKRGGNMMDITM